MIWYLCCLNPKLTLKLKSFPISVGRDLGGKSSINVPDMCVSHKQFHFEMQNERLFLVNDSLENPTYVNGKLVDGAIGLSITSMYMIKAGMTFFSLTTSLPVAQRMLSSTKDRYYFTTNNVVYGPCNTQLLEEAYDYGLLNPSTTMWLERNPQNLFPASDLIEFAGLPQVTQPSVSEMIPTKPSDPMPIRERERMVSVEEVAPVLGESYSCPYCRAVSKLEDVLSVSVSAGLLGDPVLGAHEQRRFLPANFTVNGHAIDAEGGVCTEIACPNCHMTLPSALLDTPQIIMSVIGAPGAGKSVFLASAIWQCRQTLQRKFGVGFMDLDPVANRWINAYEEKFFFQEDPERFQQIEKTDLYSADVCRSVLINGMNCLLPLPSFFQLKPSNGENACLVVYDSAGEHFRAGADTGDSRVTLNMLTADTLYFMYDPSADPRFRSLLSMNGGSARNYAQRQDTLLSEMASRIRKHLGNRLGSPLHRPLIVGISKADLLRDQLPLDMPLYRDGTDGRSVLDLQAVRTLSEITEALMETYAPEVVATIHDISTNVWFLPVSALGHNPMREGVRPCDIHSIWAELPIVFTLAQKGIIATTDGAPIPSTTQNL